MTKREGRSAPDDSTTMNITSAASSAIWLRASHLSNRSGQTYDTGSVSDAVLFFFFKKKKGDIYHAD